MSELSWEGKGVTEMLPIGPKISRIPSLDLDPWAMYQPDAITEQIGRALPNSVRMGICKAQVEI